MVGKLPANSPGSMPEQKGKAAHAKAGDAQHSDCAGKLYLRQGIKEGKGHEIAADQPL